MLWGDYKRGAYRTQGAMFLRARIEAIGAAAMAPMSAMRATSSVGQKLRRPGRATIPSLSGKPRPSADPGPRGAAGGLCPLCAVRNGSSSVVGGAAAGPPARGRRARSCTRPRSG